jgi:hypothetical protein
MPRLGSVSRLDFLRMVGTAGTAFMLLPLVSFGRTFGRNVPIDSRPLIIKRVNKVGPDGVAFLYPTRQNGFVWYMNHDEPFDSHFERGGGSTYSSLVKNEDGSWTADDNDNVKFNLNVDPEYEDAIGGCNMSFSDSIARGYTYDKNDLDNVELTGFFNVHKPTEHDGIYLRGPCNHHDEANHHCCEEFNYDCETDCNSTILRSKVKFTKQSPNEYYNDPAGVKPIVPRIVLASHGWFGIKYIHIILSRDKNNPKVKLQQWMNFNGDGKTWIKLNEVVDSRSYKWGPKAICGGEDYEVGAWGAPRMVYKWYGGDVDFKWFSCRQIDPSLIQT